MSEATRIGMIKLDSSLDPNAEEDVIHRALEIQQKLRRTDERLAFLRACNSLGQTLLNYELIGLAQGVYRCYRNKIQARVGSVVAAYEATADEVEFREFQHYVKELLGDFTDFSIVSEDVAEKVVETSEPASDSIEATVSTTDEHVRHASKKPYRRNSQRNGMTIAGYHGTVAPRDLRFESRDAANFHDQLVKLYNSTEEKAG